MRGSVPSVREIETLLSQLPWRQFQSPRVHLEQYTTPVHLAARIAHHVALCIDEDERRSVQAVDLGTGTGILALALCLAGLNHVLGVDVDSEALELARANAAALWELCPQSVGAVLEFAAVDVQPNSLALAPKSFDVAVLNPPFGTRQRSADIAFLDVACHLSRRFVYSLHKSSTRSYLSRRLERFGCTAQVYARLRFDLPATYVFHRQRAVDIDVDLWQIEVKR
jgi:predicted RNA methylase